MANCYAPTIIQTYAPSVFLWLEKNKRKIPSKKKTAPILREQDAAY